MGDIYKGIVITLSPAQKKKLTKNRTMVEHQGVVYVSQILEVLALARLLSNF